MDDSNAHLATYKTYALPVELIRLMERRAGLEPATEALRRRPLYPLSYRRMDEGAGIEPAISGFKSQRLAVLATPQHAPILPRTEEERPPGSESRGPFERGTESEG